MAATTTRFHPEGLRGAIPDSVIFGRTAEMQEVRRRIERLAGTALPVLITGESGTGKEVLAEAIHLRWWGIDRPFVRVTFPVAGSNGAESEAHAHDKVPLEIGHGFVESGRGETLFFDEISEMHPALQARLLHFLRDREIDWGGDGAKQGNDIHVICTTNRDLEAEVDGPRFRKDLLYRINAFTIDLLPLRQRKEDIPGIADYLLHLHAEKHRAPIRGISSELIDLMQRYHWPGNIRELENVVRRYVILGSEQAIGSELLARVSTDSHCEGFSEAGLSLKKLTRQVAREWERRVILKSLEKNGWNRKLAARSLNISYRALLYKVKQGGMPPKRNSASRRPARASTEN